MSLIRYSPGGGRAVVGSGKASSSSYVPVGVLRGNTLIVDQVYGNDATASAGGTPYRSVNTAVSAAMYGQTVMVLPGQYTLTGPLFLNNGTSLTGVSLQTCILNLTATSSPTTMITMGENSRVEYLSMNLGYTGSTASPVTLKGIYFGGTSSQTSKLRTSVVSVNNAWVPTGSTSTVTGIEFGGTGAPGPGVFSFNSIKASTINVYSNGSGNKRGVLVSNTNQVSTRDTNIYVAQPSDTTSTGSYVGVETNDSYGIGSIQLRATTSGINYPTTTQSYTASDILQSTPLTILDPTYLASPGIQIGPATDLVTKSAGGKGFSTYDYPTVIYYGLKGNITSAGSGGYLWPGTQTISAGQYPDTGLPAPFYRMQQPGLLSGLSASMNVAPGGTNTLTLSVYYNPASSINGTAAQGITGYISGTTLNVVSGPSSGSIAVGQSVNGPGVGLNTYIVSGSGSTWTVYPSQTAGSVGSTITITTGVPNSSFTGTISGTALTVSSVTGAIAIGQYLSGTNASPVTAGTTIVSGSGSSWVVSASQNVGPISMSTNGLLSTPFTVTFGSTDTQKSFYSASTRLNSGDRISLYTSYTSGSPANGAHDITCQLDMF